MGMTSKPRGDGVRSIAPESHLRRFVHDADLQSWQMKLVWMDGAGRAEMQTAVAWHLRQRDPLKARELAREAEDLLTPEADLDGSLRGRLSLVYGEVHWLLAELDLAVAAFDAAMARFSASGDARGLSDAHWLRAWIALDQGDPERRDLELVASARAARAAEDSLRLDLAEAALARCAVFRDLGDAVSRWGERFIARGSGSDPSLMVWIEDFRGLVASKSQRVAPAVAHYVRMYEAALRTGQIQRAITAASNIGFDLTRLNDHHAALEWMQRALDLARTRAWPASLGVCLCETAETLRQLDRLDAAETLLHEALQVLQPLGRTRWRALALNYLGDVALDRSEHAQALAKFEELAKLSQSLEQADLQSIAARGCAHALAGLGRIEEALSAARLALAGSEGQQDDYNQIAALRVIAAIRAREAPEAPDAGLDEIATALQIAARIEGYITPPELLEAAARGQAGRGDFAEAFRLSQQAIAARERIHSELANQRAVAMQIRRETEAARSEAEQQRQLAEAESRRAELLQVQNRTLERLGGIGQAITATLSLDSVLELLASQVHDLLETDAFGIYLLRAEGEALESALLIENGERLPVDRIALDSPLRHAARCARDRAEILLGREQVDGDPSQVPGSLGTLSAMFAPLTIGERLLGVITVQSLRGSAYAERERLIFRSLAAYGAIALHNAAAYRELQTAHHELGALSELSSRLQSCASSEDAYRCLARAGEHIFPGSRGVLFLRDERGLEAAAAGGWGEASDAAARPALCMQCPALGSRASWHPGGSDLCPVSCDAASNELHDRACVPLAADEGEAFGVLMIEFAAIGEGIGLDRRYPLALALAEQTALALSNLRLREALHQQSIRDGLTGVFNRRHLDAALARELNRCMAHGQTLALVIIDIDHFKAINDRYGHAAGDEVIRTVARLVKQTFRRGDEVCRFGGEEFVVLLADADAAVAMERAESLRMAMHELRVKHGQQRIGPVTVSVGVALHPRHGLHADALLGAADAALYAAKQGGRDQVRLAAE